MPDPKLPYLEACHAMQSGVAMEMNFDPEPTSPKHLRVGVNSAMCEHAALIDLLVAKGIITTEEYMAALTDCMNREVDMYESDLSDRVGSKVTLR